METMKVGIASMVSKSRMAKARAVISKALYDSKIELTYTEAVKVYLDMATDWSKSQLKEERDEVETGICSNCGGDTIFGAEDDSFVCPHCGVFFGVPPIENGACTRCGETKFDNRLNGHKCIVKPEPLEVITKNEGVTNEYGLRQREPRFHKKQGLWHAVMRHGKGWQCNRCNHWFRLGQLDHATSVQPTAGRECDDV